MGFAFPSIKIARGYKPISQWLNLSRPRVYSPSTATCYNCGLVVISSSQDMPRRGKIGHFARVCRSTKSHFTRNTVQNINASISDDEVEDKEYIYSVKPAQSQTQHALHVKLSLCQVYVNNKPVDMLIDSGASVYIMFRG